MNLTVLVVRMALISSADRRKHCMACGYALVNMQILDYAHGQRNLFVSQRFKSNFRQKIYKLRAIRLNLTTVP